MAELSHEDLEKIFQRNPANENRVENSRLDQKKIRLAKSQIKKFGKQKRKNDFGFILKFCFWVGLAGFLFFILIGSESFYVEAKWVYFTDYLNQSFPSLKIATSPTAEATATNTPPSLIALPDNLPQFAADGNYLKIDKIGVNAPITWNVDESQIVNELINGVVHYKGTSLPGEGGNVFLTGHSSNYFWIKSDYNSIFALLGKLEKGDRIEIRKGNQSYFYTVSDSKVVSADDVSVLQKGDHEILSLMTCWPVGTSLNRLIVQAELLYTSN